MKTASSLFNQQDRREIEAAILDAEKKTSGEIMPVVVTSSGRYDRAEDICGLLVGVAALATFCSLFPPTGQPGWNAAYPTQCTFISVAIVIIGFIVGAIMASRFPCLRLFFIPKKEMQDEVDRRSADIFYRYRVGRTEKGSGILIYVSLYEHIVKVVGDSPVVAKIPQQEWDAICHMVLEGMKSGNPAGGLKQAIQKSGALLAHHFPPNPNDKNELSNSLIVLD